jgi:Mg2+ and Co2+ transporter CorA
MSAPDPESFDLLSKVVGAAVAVGVPIWGAKTWLDKQLSAKADKAHAALETANCLRHIERLYENAEEDRKQTRDLHDKAMEAISRNQSEIIGRLK